MAKALLGHLGPVDVRSMVQVRRLQQRVRELEAEVLRLRAENDALAAAMQHDQLLTLPEESVLA